MDMDKKVIPHNNQSFKVKLILNTHLTQIRLMVITLSGFTIRVDFR